MNNTTPHIVHFSELNNTEKLVGVGVNLIFGRTGFWLDKIMATASHAHEQIIMATLACYVVSKKLCLFKEENNNYGT